MTTPQSDPTAVSTGDRLALYLTIGSGATVAIFTVILFIARTVEILTNHNVPVLASFMGTTAKLPLGPNGALMPVEIEQGSIEVSGMPAITIVALILAAATTALSSCALIICFCLFCRNILAGRAFGRSNNRLILAAAIAVTVGWGLGAIFTTLGVNGAFATLSNNSYANFSLELPFTPLLVVFALGVIGVAFQMGGKLQRETEGLV